VQPTYDTLEAIELQAAACDHICSPLYAQLLRGIAADYRADGLSRTLLEHASERPQHDAIPLRYLATAHRLALAGKAPTLAQHFASCGGSWSGADITPDFLTLVEQRHEMFVEGLTRQVQTNEVGRAAAVACGLAHVQQQFDLALRTFEVGASAGLLSRVPWFRIDTGTSACGPEDSPLRLGPEWFAIAPPTLPTHLEVVEQAAADIMPLDVDTDAGRLAIQSFVWPDQMERMERLRSALAIADEHPLHVERSDAGAWLSRHVTAPTPTGVATVVFHSIVWQYLPPWTRDQLKATLAAVAPSATRQSPLCWLRMEPAGETHADLRLTVWPGGHETHLADVGYHGHDLTWLA